MRNQEVNYRQQRSERNRAKQNKKDAKLRGREEATAGRKLEAEQQGELPHAPECGKVGALTLCNSDRSGV